jgi:hypothetical protein
MVSLQPKLNLRVAQRQILTPGLMQMVSVLALNKRSWKRLCRCWTMWRSGKRTASLPPSL